MSKLLNSRKALIALVVIVAFVAVVVPTCRMIGCTMEMRPGMMGVTHGMAELGFSPRCDGSLATFRGPVGIVPASSDALVLALVASVVAALALFSPQMASRPVLIVEAVPPPPPEDPLGARFRV